jgi:hypothetical protein
VTLRYKLSLLLAVAVALSVVPLARADGDPASDVLYGNWVFVPFSTKVSSQEELLEQTVLAARRAGYPIKVAIIGGPSDLGAVPELFSKPQLYARFLGLELRFVRYGGRLLVLMPNGFGIYHHAHPTLQEQRALEGIAVDQEGVDGLAASATTAVRRLAALDGHKLPALSVPETHSSVGRDRIVIAAAALGLALVIGALAIWRRRRASLSPRAR